MRERERYRRRPGGGVPRQQQVRVKGRGHPHVGHEAQAGLEGTRWREGVGHAPDPAP